VRSPARPLLIALLVTISGRRVSAYEGFLLEAQDARGEPYAIVDRSWRTRNIAGWFDSRDFVPVPAAFTFS
jgi:hypothetical protein